LSNRVFLFVLLIPQLISAQEGSLAWAKVYQGGVNYSAVTAVEVDAAGNVYTCGIFRDSVDFSDGPLNNTLVSSGSEDIFITKHNVEGDLLWAKQVGALGSDKAKDLAVTETGDVLIIGEFYGTGDFYPGSGEWDLTSTGVGSRDIFILKLTGVGGAFIWVKQIGGIKEETANDIVLDESGNFLITGQFRNVVDFDPGSGVSNMTSAGQGDAYLAKFSSSGTLIWCKQYGGFGSFGTGSSEAVNVNLRSDGNIILTGNFIGVIDIDTGALGTSINSSSGNIFIFKLDPTGTPIWWRTLGCGLYGADEVTSTVLDSLDNIILTGYFYHTLDGDPGLGTQLITSVGDYDVFILRLTSEGDYDWIAQTGGNIDYPGGPLDIPDYSTDVDVDEAGNIYTTGRFRSISDFDPGAGIYLMGDDWYSIGAFVLKLDPAGNFIWARQISFDSSGGGNCLAVGVSESVLVGGSISGAVGTFDPGGEEIGLECCGGFLIKIHQTPLGLSEVEDQPFDIYPNPAQDNLYFSKPLHVVEIVDLSGRKWFSENGETNSIDISGLQPGIYLLQSEFGSHKFAVLD